MEGPYLKRLKDGSCLFLEKSVGLYYCGIHEQKPDACRKWPFVKVAGVEMANLACPELVKIKDTA